MLTPSRKEEFLELLRKYQHQKASPQEIEFLEKYYLFFDQEEKKSLNLSPAETALLENEFFRNIERIIGRNEESRLPAGKSFSMIWKIAAAAIIVLVCSATIYFSVNLKPEKRPGKIADISKRYKNDLSPGGNKAILTLADGSHINLDSVHNGKIGNQGNSGILKLNNGELAYRPRPEITVQAAGAEIKYNTISTPKGGQYQIVLADGSRVWLNAASSLRFPVSFNGKERQVELTGEAYFEVATQYRKAEDGKTMGKIPFYVNVNKTQVQVLGTHFNINAYDDESSIKTTLLEGVVKVVNGDHFTLLKPGSQSEVYPDGRMEFADHSNVEDAVAWKNGMFEFRSADIEAIMRQMARWYDVEVNYEKEIDEKFYAEIPRNTRASDVFKILEATGAVHFEIEGRKVEVLP